MKKIIIMLIIATSFSCKDGITEPAKGYDVEYVVQSIRIDDDAEYHIVAVSQNGDIKALEDADIPQDIVIQYGGYSSALLIVHMCPYKGGYVDFVSCGKPKVLLPINYKIETFKD
jgi:hypothetical protein